LHVLACRQDALKNSFVRVLIISHKGTGFTIQKKNYDKGSWYVNSYSSLLV